MRPSSLLVSALLAACQVSTTDNFHNPPPGPPDTCSEAERLPGCDQGSRSYACSATDRPDGPDADLVCSTGAPGARGATLYCCAPFSRYFSDCAPDPALAGCGGPAMGFACTGATTPSDADPTIACSASIGAGEYCCNTAQPIPTCAADASVPCSGTAAGYRCAGTAPPLASGFTCAAQPGATALETSYCCVPST